MSSKKGYPKNWKEISTRIKAAAGWKCERCKTPHGPVPNVLTTHHLDGNKKNCADWNLAALCQRCHLTIQGRVKMDQLFFALEVLPISNWFRPHYEGYLQSIGLSFCRTCQQPIKKDATSCHHCGATDFET